SDVCSSDLEGEGQPSSEAIAKAAAEHGLQYHYLPMQSGNIRDENVTDFTEILSTVHGPVMAIGRTGTRSTSLWASSQASRESPDVIQATTQAAGYDLSGMQARLAHRWQCGPLEEEPTAQPSGQVYDALVVGGGAGGSAVAASLLKRSPELRIGVIEPNELHYYQPGWT